ncbi:hypothetical protein DNH61_03595 [Paenibacillus sambharensis]|uniref:GRAM domain-containing protein n=1 Tax=Paenibacillus sambharensis TaxID=1803190 RepID=A0A2W1LQK7_9BACL|nr:hypothetical protein [Paenibacillus sambharensis]PZD97232.1 hypothetical protein DNH61_03595 [Paenibacillus sambharensis]
MDQTIAGTVVIFIATLLLIFLYRIISLKKNYKQEEKLLVDYLSNFYGVSSKGMRQIRGNGILLLSRNNLIFEMYIPRKKYTISLDTISEISKVNGHLGKVGFNLLKVKFKSENYCEEAAWAVNDVDEWIKQLVIMSHIADRR